MWVTVLPRRYSQPYGSAPKARSHELWVMCEQVWMEGGGIENFLLSFFFMIAIQFSATAA